MDSEKMKQETEKVNNILAVVLEYMQTKFKAVIWDRKCLNCPYNCKNARYDLSHNLDALIELSEEEIKLAKIMSERDIPVIATDKEGNKFMELYWFVDANKKNPYSLNAEVNKQIADDLALKGVRPEYVKIGCINCRRGFTWEITLTFAL